MRTVVGGGIERRTAAPGDGFSTSVQRCPRGSVVVVVLHYCRSSLGELDL